MIFFTGEVRFALTDTEVFLKEATLQSSIPCSRDLFINRSNSTRNHGITAHAWALLSNGKIVAHLSKEREKKILIKVFELQDFRSKVQSSESMRNSIQQLGLPQISRHSCRNLLRKLNRKKYQLFNSSSDKSSNETCFTCLGI